MRCRITTYGDPYWIVFHVRSQTTWDYSWLRWDF
jgi:hypothetical protein